MPPRFAYWTIIVGGQPTAFRSQYRDDLLPTLKQLQNRHPDAVMMWFARGRLWGSPEDARAAQRHGTGERRGPDWRPGGEHRDPRARHEVPRDVRRRRFAERLRRQERPGDRPRHDRREPQRPGPPPPDERRPPPGGGKRAPHETSRTRPAKTERPDVRKGRTDRPRGGSQRWGGQPAGKGGGRPAGRRAPHQGKGRKPRGGGNSR